MTPAKTIAVVLLVTLLAADLAVANAVVGAERSVLDPAFVTSSLDSEGAYDQVEPIVLEQLQLEELSAADGQAPPFPVDTRAVVAAAIDAGYLQSQVEPNIEATYAYLHGSSDTLELAVDAEPAKRAIVAAVEAELTNATASELLGSFGLGEGALAVEADGFSVDLVTVAEMAANESVFDAEREAVRADLRDRAVGAAVDDAFSNASRDELLALVIEDYDPADYTDAEKEQLVADNETDIRTALRERVEANDGDAITAAVDDQLVETRDALRANVSAALAETGDEIDPAIGDPIEALALVAVDGYVADVSHREFSTEFEAAAADLAVGVATLLEVELDEQIPDQVALVEASDTETAEALAAARQAVRLVDTLAIGLPVVGVGLVGVIYLVSRTVAVTAAGAGVGLVGGGLPGLVGARIVPRELRTLLTAGELPRSGVDLVVTLAGQVADVLFWQSAAVVGIGAVLLGLGLALHYERLDLATLTGEE